MSSRTPKSKRQKTQKKKSEDVVLVYGRDEAEGAFRVLRKRDDRIEAGVIGPVQAGKSITGELVRLSPREDQPLVYDVETQYDATIAAPPSDDLVQAAGPAQVATEAYRDGWDRLWGRGRRKASSALN